MSATIDGPYRYTLERGWDDNGPWVTFIMLNPSTADADTDDPTIRRCIGFAKREGFVGLRVFNLYALRATDPRELWQHADPVGPRNDTYLQEIFGQSAWFEEPVFVAWGANAKADRTARFQEIAARYPTVDVRCFGTNKDGSPKHPLYLPGSAELVKWPA